MTPLRAVSKMNAAQLSRPSPSLLSRCLGSCCKAPGACPAGQVARHRPGLRLHSAASNGWPNLPGIGAPARSIAARAGKPAAPTEEFEPEMGSLYDRPDLYETAFSYREFDKEVSFLQEMFLAKGSGQPLKSVVDLGCGTARHLRGLAAAGISCFGVDLNKEMLQFAEGRAKEEGVEVSLMPGDMRSVDLPDEVKGADMATVLMGTMQHMLTNADAIAAVQTAKDAVRSGGIVVLELAHPYDLWDGTLAGAEDYPEVWMEDMQDGSKLYMEWGREGDPFDGLTQVLERTVCVTVTKNDKHVLSLVDICEMRQFSMQELNLIAESLDLDVIGVYGEMDMAVELDDDEAYRLVMCMQKR